jgi:hypothetical protein
MPAFPVMSCMQNTATGETLVFQAEWGLTKREYFAGLAMQGFLAHGENSSLLQAETHLPLTRSVAIASVEYADALLAALEKSDE